MRVRVVSVDLAYKDYRDIGVVIIESGSKGADYELIDLNSRGRLPEPDQLAEMLVDICRQQNVTALMLDGPQAWKSSTNGLAHSRQCERALNTPGKTGLPGVAKPATYLPFMRFSVMVFDALDRLGWSRYAGNRVDPRMPVAIESFPLSAWRGLGLKSLPAKSKSKEADIRSGLSALIERGLYLDRLAVPTHDQLQALVSGLGGICLLAGRDSETIVAGTAPFIEEDIWREGHIVTPGGLPRQ